MEKRPPAEDVLFLKAPNLILLEEYRTQNVSPDKTAEESLLCISKVSFTGARGSHWAGVSLKILGAWRP